MESNERDTRCPTCNKLLMKGNAIKCPRCKNLVEVDHPIYKDETIKVLSNELYRLKLDMGLVN